ncbi:MAG: hypothetical protein BJG00_012745 [Limnothrix sp. CACIAM 69d]|nr:MAG: hypothetical protein BJG00_012745 [Limnothrix sp. CACIAM 69d]
MIFGCITQVGVAVMTEVRMGKRIQYTLTEVEREILALVQMLAHNSTVISSATISACSRYTRPEVEQALSSLMAAGLICQR